MPIDIIARGMSYNNSTQLNDITKYTALPAIANIYNFNLDNSTNKNFTIETVADTLQIETATVVGTITTAGNATVIITAFGMTGSPKTISVAVALSDTAILVAGKIRTVLVSDVDVSAKFTVVGTDASIILTKKIIENEDLTLNINIANGTCAGLTNAPTSVNTNGSCASKTMSFSNISIAIDLILNVNVKMKFTNNAIINFPVGTIWKDNTTPTFTVGKQYFITFLSYDNGLTWLVSFVGAW